MKNHFDYIAKQLGETNDRTKPTDKARMKQLKKLAVDKHRGIYIKLKRKKPFIVYEGITYPIKDAVVVYAKKNYSRFYCLESDNCLTNMDMNNDDDNDLDHTFTIMKEDIVSERGELLKSGLKLYFYQDDHFEWHTEQPSNAFYEFICLYLRTKDYALVCTVEYDENNRPVVICDCTNSIHTKRIYKALTNNIAKLMVADAIKQGEGITSSQDPINLEGEKDR